METRLIATITLMGSITLSKAEIQRYPTIAEFRNFMVREVKRKMWHDIYNDLVGPIKELQAKALYHAQENQDISAVREINARIDKLLEYP